MFFTRIMIWWMAFWRITSVLIRSAYHWIMIPIRTVWYVINWVFVIIAAPFALLFALLKSIAEGKWKV